MFFVSCWFVFLIILVSLSQFTERKNLNGKLNDFSNPLFFFSRLCSAGNPHNYWTVLFSYSSIPLFIGFVQFLCSNKDFVSTCTNAALFLHYSISQNIIHEATQSIFSFPTILLYLNNIWQMHVVFIPTMYIYIHTYTFISFIYAQNTQCSCRANIFEKLS